VLEALHIISKHVVPQPVKNGADILSIFKEPLWAKDGTLRYTKMQSGGIGFTGAHGFTSQWS